MRNQMRDAARSKALDLRLSSYLALRAQDYAHPQDVLRDETLTLAEKRSLLEVWASDAAAVETHPGFRWLPGTPGPIALPHVRAAMEILEDTAESRRDDRCIPHVSNAVKFQSIGVN